MKRLHDLIGSVFVVLLFGGCGSGVYKGPVALEEDQLPTVIREAFAAAPQQTREIAEKAVLLFEEEKFPESIAEFRRICALREITDERREIASRCLITLTAKIQEAADMESDTSAEKYIRYNQVTK